MASWLALRAWAKSKHKRAGKLEAGIGTQVGNGIVAGATQGNKIVEVVVWLFCAITAIVFVVNNKR